MLRHDHAHRLPAIAAVSLVLLILALVPAVAGAATAPASAKAAGHRRAAAVHHRVKAAAHSKAKKTKTKVQAAPVTTTASSATSTPAAPVTQNAAVSPSASAAPSAAAASAPATATAPTRPTTAALAPAITSDDAADTTDPSAGSVANFNRETFEYSSNLSTSAEANRYQVMVLQATDADKIPALKAANPNLKILIYQDPELARPSDPTGYTVCSDWQDLAGADSSWLLRDQNNNSIPDADLAGNYLMDVGNAAYQKSCVAHAIALAKQDGADGVYFDDTNASVTWYLPAGTTVPEYPTDSAWQDAETSFLTYATAQLHAQGLVSYANIGGASNVPGLWAKWNSLVDGAMEQSWNNWDNSADEISYAWQGMLQDAAWSEAHDKYDILQSIDSGEQENTFGLASMMLVANGYTSYSTANDYGCSQENWYGTYTAAQDLGAPEGSYTELANGLYARYFHNGVVVVNPTTASNLTLSLPGTMTDAATGQSETSLDAGADSGYILQYS